MELWFIMIMNTIEHSSILICKTGRWATIFGLQFLIWNNFCFNSSSFHSCQGSGFKFLWFKKYCWKCQNWTRFGFFLNPLKANPDSLILSRKILLSSKWSVFSLENIKCPPNIQFLGKNTLTYNEYWIGSLKN